MDASESLVSRSEDKRSFRSALRVSVSSALGYGFESYDLTVFLFAATLMAPSFFPSNSYLSSLLYAYLAFALAFIARPIGGFVFGHFGDKLGRKRTWFSTLLGMGIATVLIGFLPTYSQIGFLAPSFLVVLRLLQGFFLAGEQSGGWTLTEEVAPPERRGLFGGVVNAGMGVAQIFLALAIVLSSSIVLIPGVDSWRVLFWFGALPLFIALIVRWKIVESGEWKQKARASVEKIPIATAVRTSSRFFIIVSIASFGGVMVAYGSTIFIPSFLRLYTNGVTPKEIVLVTLGINAAYIVGAPIGGYLSDRLRSRKKFLALAYLVNSIIVLPTMLGLETGSLQVMLAVGVLFGFVNSFFLSIVPAWVSENIATRVRYSFLAVAGNIGPAFGVFAPYLIASFSGNLGPAYAAWLVAGSGGLVAALSVMISPNDRVAQPLL